MRRGEPKNDHVSTDVVSEPSKETDDDPSDEVSELRLRIAELEQQLADAKRSCQCQKRAPETEGEALLERFRVTTPEQRALLDALPVMVFFKDRSHQYLFVNKTYADHHQMSASRFIGKRDEEIFIPETAQINHDNDEACMASGKPQTGSELIWTLEDGSSGWTIENDVPLRNASGEVVGMMGVVVDITQRKQAEEAVRRAEAELRDVLERQGRLMETISALSTPVLPIDDGVLALPLVGHIDTTRSSQIMETLLAEVAASRAEFVIVDLTGVPVIDTFVARHLVRTTRAVRLLGAECILVGISSAMAQSLVHIGEGLMDLIISSNLKAGVRYARSRRQNGGGREARGTLETAR